MSFVLQPWQLLLTILSGLVHRRQQQIIEFQNSEIEALLKVLDKKRILLTDDQRRILAVKGKVLGRKTLQELTTIVTPDTILRWHRELVAKKWDHSEKRKVGRPRIRQVIVDLILRFAQENPTWGYDRIQGALANVGYNISDRTVGNILKAHGIEPAPDRQRQTTWATFLKAHWDVLAAIDFTTIEVWTRHGLVTYYLLFVMELSTRRVHFAGCTTNPDAIWMKQIARNLIDVEDGFLNGKRYLLMDRDGKFCPTFRRILKGAGIEPLLLPPRSPNLNAYMERFMRSLKSESLSRMIFFGEKSLRRAIAAFLDHYHVERNHQGLGNQIPEPGDEVGQVVGKIECREQLGGRCATITEQLPEGNLMINWLKQRLHNWISRVQQLEIERLHAEGVRLKAEVLKNNGGKPIRLSPEEHQRLNELRKKIDPDVLAQIELLDDAE